MSTRRKFLALSSAAIAASALPGELFAQFPTEVFSNANLGAYAQGLLTQGTFEKHIGSVFKAFLPNRSVSYLTLLAVRERTLGTGTGAAAAPRGQAGSSPAAFALAHGPVVPQPGAVRSGSSFDLIFAVEGPALEEASYTLDHGILGRFAVFVVPGISPAGEPRCCASFNYLTGAAAAPVPITTRGFASFLK